MEMGVGSVDRVPEKHCLVSGRLRSCPRVRNSSSDREEASKVLELKRLMEQIGGQWMPQDGLSLCLSDPTAGQSQLPEQLASEHLLCAGLWVDATHVVSQCN